MEQEIIKPLSECSDGEVDKMFKDDFEKMIEKKTKCDLCKKKIDESDAHSTESFVLCIDCLNEVGEHYNKYIND